MQNRNITSVLFRSRRATMIAAATTIVLSGMNVASAIDLHRTAADTSAREQFTISLAPAGFDSVRGVRADFGAGHASSDVVRNYSGGATGVFSAPGDWGGTALGAGDSPNFGTTPAGNITVTNDETGLTFGDLTEGRSSVASTVTLNGGYTGNRIEISTGTLTLNGGATLLNSDFPDTGGSTLYGARIGFGATGVGAINIQNGATVAYHDFLHGSTGGNGTVLVTGATTTITPTVGNVRADFRGGGGGTSNVTITNGATVTANLVLPNNNDNTTISNGATFNALNYTNPTNFGGQIEVGYFPVADGAPVPVSTYTVDNATVNTTFFDVGTGTNTNAVVLVKNGGKLNARNSFSTNEAGAIGTFTITGVGSFMGGAGPFVGGGDDGDTGAGTTNLNVLAGATVAYSQSQFGGNIGLLGGANYNGSNITIDGAGSAFKMVGTARTTVDPTASNAIDGSMFLNNAGGVTGTINVTNGGLLDLLSTDTDTARNGALVMAQGPNSTTTINVTGANSVFNAGVFVQVSQVSDVTAEIVDNTNSTFNIKDGGSFLVTDDGAVASGNAQFGIAGDATLISPGAAIVINVGGGVTATDVNSTFDAQGGVFLGGGGTFAAPTYGIPVTVNVNNGSFNGGAVVVGRTSVINLNRGTLAAGLISVRGGSIKLSPTAAPGVGVLIADAYEVGTNGFIDIGKSGGISVINAGDTTDLSSIKALIVAGLTGGTNSIRSSALTPITQIGYALRSPSLASFLGITFDPGDQAVLFRVTLKGDADLSGTVGFPDLVNLAQNYNGTGKEWFNGDFDYDGDVDFGDLVSLAQNYNGVFSLADADALGGGEFAADWALAQSLVPEPASLSVLAAAAALLRRRRR